MDIIETERLILRNIEENDAEDIYEYCKNPSVGINAGWPAHKSIDETKSIMGTLFLNQKNIFGMIDKKSNKLIGTIGFLPDPKRENTNVLMLGYAMAEDYWGKGLMSEAAEKIISYGFNTLNIDMISCMCYTDNIRSNRVIEKCGFNYDGCLRKGELRFDGVVKDLKLFSLTHNEWLKSRL